MRGTKTGEQRTKVAGREKEKGTEVMRKCGMDFGHFALFREVDVADEDAEHEDKGDFEQQGKEKKYERQYAAEVVV